MQITSVLIMFMQCNLNKYFEKAVICIYSNVNIWGAKCN